MADNDSDGGTARPQGSATGPSGPPAGWLPDPGDNGLERYWDGSSWIAQRSSAAVPVPASAPRSAAVATNTTFWTTEKILSSIAMLALVIGGIIAIVLIGRSPEAYPANVQANYLTSCENNGGDSGSCQCTLKWFESNVSLGGFELDNQNASTNAVVGGDPSLTVPIPDITNATKACE